MKKNRQTTRSSLLIPDERNLGGRNQITNLIYNHQNSLLNVKPTVKTFSDSVKQKKNKKNLLNEIVRFAEVFESFRRVNNVKFSNFTAPPKSFNLTKNLQKPIPFKVRLDNYNHSLNLKRQKQRIAELNSAIQRKKNIFDYKAYPSLFFRRTNKSTFWCKSSEYDSKSKNKTNDENDEFVFDEKDIEKMLKEKKEQEILQRQQEEEQFFSEANNLSDHNKQSENGSSHQKNKENVFENRVIKKKQNKKINNKNNGRPQSAASNSANNKNSSNKENILDDQEYQGLIPIPKMNKNSEEDLYEKLKDELIEIINKNKIYDADSLETLFGRTLLHNPQMEKEKIEEIFINVFEELEAGQKRGK